MQVFFNVAVGSKGETAGTSRLLWVNHSLMMTGSPAVGIVEILVSLVYLLVFLVSIVLIVLSLASLVYPLVSIVMSYPLVLNLFDLLLLMHLA